jgi:hypothetical protein
MSDTIDGRPITAHGGALRKAGDGLSDALKLQDVKLQIGDEVTLLVKGTVAPPSFKPDKNNATGIMRVDNINVASAQVVTDAAEIEDQVRDHQAAVAEMKRLEKEAKEGIQRIEFDEDEDHAQAAEDGVTPDNVRPLNPTAADAAMPEDEAAT